MDSTPARIAYQGCPLCESADTQVAHTADCSKHPLYNPIFPPTMTWLRCLRCEHVFTDGYFTPEAARVIFSKTNEHQKVGADIERQRGVSARVVEKVISHVATGTWLDVGFGNGSLLFTAHEYGFVPVGIDLGADNVAVLKSMGIESHCSNIETFVQPARFDVISMADVLEHMPFPRKALTAAHALMRPGGVLFLSMPNLDSVLWQVLTETRSNPYWAELEHHHNFGRRRLYRLLEETAFEPLRFGISERYRACMEVLARKRS